MASGLGPAPLDLLETLKETSSATVSMTLYRMGYRLIYMSGVRPIRAGAKLVGRAVTLRYLPKREDHVVTSETRRTYAQQLALESVGKGDVLVVDARGNTDAGIFGDIYASRIRYRGAAGVVTDGALRDSPYLRTIDFPCFVRSVHGFAHNAQHWAADMNLPIACGNVLVEPDDILVGDDDGVAVIPRKLAEEVAEVSVKQENKEVFLRELIDKGESVQRFDVDPFTPEMQQRYEEWLKERRR